MVIKPFFYRLLRIHAFYNAFGKVHFLISSKPISQKNTSSLHPDDFLIITIAFNNVELIAQQIESIKKHLTDSCYRHVIVDNSSDKNKRNQIMEVCQAQNIEYKEVPYSLSLKFCHWISLFSMSHGIALNWAYYNVISPRSPKYFALLDHDILPVKSCSFSSAIGDTDFYGVKRVRNGGWYIWPGWGVYKFQVFASGKVNFLPFFNKHVFFDTGGSNYKNIYAHYELQKIKFPMVKFHRLKTTNDLHTDDAIYHSDYIQSIDNAWIHLINGSNYYQIQGKEQTIKNIINDISFFEDINY